MDPRPIRQSLPYPGDRHAFLDPGRDHLGDVPSAYGDAFAGELQGAVFGANLFGPGFEFLGARDEWAKVETEGHLDVATTSPAGVALAVGAVAADHQTAIDEDGEMAPQRRRRHPMRPRGQLLVGRK